MSQHRRAEPPLQPAISAMQPHIQPTLLLHHPTRAITTFSLSSHSQLYALGSRNGVYLYSITDAFLASPSSFPPGCVQLLYSDGAADVAVSRFNPHHCQQSVIATSSGPSLYLWDLNSPLHPLQSLHTAAHSNQHIQSLSWSNAHPMHFASVSAQVNADLLVWDARDTNSPLVALPAAHSASPSIAPASSSFVAFHPFVSYLVASSSDTAVCIYDLRYPTGSVESFQSPLASPLGSLCWSQWQWRHLVTGNKSQQVEVWSMSSAADHSSVTSPTTTSSAERLTYQLQTKDGLLAAWTTPFGHGLVTHCAADTALQLWNVGTRLGQARGVEWDTTCTDVTEVARLEGASAVQLIDWHLPVAASSHSSTSRVGLSDETAPQLWTVCHDRTIRVYEIPAHLRHTCGEAAEDGTDVAALSASTDRDVSVASSLSLRSELSHCQRTLPSFRYYSFSSLTRSCAAVVSSSHPAHSLLLQITFPASYPSAAPPVFAVQPGSSTLFIAADVVLASFFLHQLSALCLPYVEQGQRCLLPALAFLQAFVQDAVNRSPVVAADSPHSEDSKSTSSGSRKQVRIEERKELRERKQQQPIAIRKGVASASTPSLTSLSSSAYSQPFRLSTSLTSPSPLEDESSPAYSAEQSDEEEGSSRDMSAASSSSAMQTMVEEDEETESDNNQRGPTAAVADSKKRKEERDFELLCPRLCGVSWGPRGELVMFNNFPALTHYIQQTKEQRRLRAAGRQQPHSAGSEVDEKADGAQPGKAHHRHTSFMLDHDEDEWDEINQADIEPAASTDDTPHDHTSTNAGEQGAAESEQPDRTMDVFPPRTFGHLLQLPFLASYLEPVIREATDAENGGPLALIRGTGTGVDRANTDAIGMNTVSLGAALAVEQNAADGNSSDSDEEQQTVNLDAASLSSLAAFSSPSEQKRTHERNASDSSSVDHTPVNILSPAHSRHASTGTIRDATPVAPVRPSSPSLLPSAAPVISPSLRPLAVLGSGRHDKQLASSSIVALPVHTGVLITDLSCLFPVDATLSASYPLLPPSRSSSAATASELCAAFEQVCERHCRHDLVRMWQLLSLVFRPALLDQQQTEQTEEGAGWSEGWAGGAWTGRLVQRLMSDCWQQGDIESVGLIACLLSRIPRPGLLTPNVTISAPFQPFVPPLPPLFSSPSPPLILGPGALPRSLSSHLLRPAFPNRSLSALPLHPPSSAGTVPPPMLRSHSGSSDGAHDRSPLSDSSHVAFPASSSLPTASSYPSIAAAMSQSPSSSGPSSPVVLGSPPIVPSPNAAAAGGSAVAAAVLSVSVGMCDLYRLLYADWLARLGLMLHRAAVLKCSDVQQSGDAMEVLAGWNTNELRVGFDAACQRCGQPLTPHSQSHASKSASPSMLSPVRCAACNAYSAHCVVCHLSVRGLSSYCLACGHGGHMSHMQEWFDGGEKECATGCGCLCSQEQMS